MEDRVYTLYLYKWTDGSYYIGRTFTSSGRFNNSEKYKQQYVYKKMLSDPSYRRYIFNICTYSRWRN